MKLSLLGSVSFLGLGLCPLAALAAGPSAEAHMVEDLDAGRGAAVGLYPQTFVPLGDRILFEGFDGTYGSLLYSVALPDLEVESLSPSSLGGGWPSGLLATDGARVYWYEETNYRAELYCSDGSAVGTRLVHRFDKGPGPSAPPHALGLLGGVGLFTGFEAETGLELWRSDCTEEGTFRLEDLAPGPGSSSPRHYVLWGDELCFLADLDLGTGVFCTDGSPGGTKLVWGFGDVGGSYEGPAPLIEVAGRLVFVIYEPDSERIMASDGTPAGTVTLLSLPPAGWLLLSPFRSGEACYFVADDVVHGQELWQTDGTPGGTRRISEFGFASAFASASCCDGDSIAVPAGGWTYFLAWDGLTSAAIWRTDGSPTSTQPVDVTSVEPDPLNRLIGIGERVVIASVSALGDELYSIDGPTGAVQVLLDVCPGPCGSDPTLPYETGDTWFFEASPDGVERELYVTDGTPLGTRLATRTENGSSSIQWADRALAYVQGRLFYAGSDAVHGTELFVSDLSGAPSALVADLANGAHSSGPFAIASLGSSAVFLHCREDNGGLRLSWTNGAPEHVEALADLGSICPVFNGSTFDIESASGAAFVLDATLAPAILRRTDGTPAGTAIVLTSEVGEELQPGAMGAGYYWFSRRRDSSTEIWKAPEGGGAPSLHVVLPPALGGAWNLYFAGGHLYFVSGETETGYWRVIRAETSAAALEVLPATLDYTWFNEGAGPLFVWDGRYLYFRTGTEWSSELWRDDPALESTLLLTPDEEVGGVRDLAAGDGFVFFFTLRNRLTLWKSDGTLGGTSAVADLEDEGWYEQMAPRPVAVVGPRLAFAAWSDSTGRELWISDGTSAGTFPAPEIFPGLGSSSPGDFTVEGQRLFLSATDPMHGREIWRLDFSEARLDRLTDVAPGVIPAQPAELAPIEGKLLFQGNDGIHGAELWALSTSESSCLPNARALCLDDGRFQLEASWADFFGGSGDGVAVPLTADTGYFWFFDPANVETVTKVLDGLGVNERYWVFYGALSNVEFALDVTDTATRVKKRYLNPPGRYASVGDVNAFAPDGALTAGPTNTVEEPGTDGSPWLLNTLVGEIAASGTCTPSATRLCLQQGRFAVEASWRDFQGNTGIGTAVPLSADTGYFWFFWDTNVEVILKVLDGRPVNDRFWVYYGALSNVEYTLTVTDTLTGEVKTYFNPAGRFASVGDNEAF